MRTTATSAAARSGAARSLFPEEATRDSPLLTAESASALPPSSLLCPISGELMEDPVLTEEFQTYDRASIAQWLQLKQTDPLTNKPIGVRLRPNVALMGAIRAWKLAHTVESASALPPPPSLPPSLPPSPPPTVRATSVPRARIGAGQSASVRQPWPALTLKGVACKLCLKKGQGSFCHHHR